MRFTRVLHPEIILDKRGSAEARGFYQTVKDLSIRVGNGLGLSKRPENTYQNGVWRLLERDPNLTRHMLHCQVYREMGQQAKTYHLGKDFALALSRIDREIPIDVLPENFIGYVSFPESTVFDEDGEVQGGYIWLGVAGEKDILASHEKGWKPEGERFISMSYVNSKMIGDLFPITTVTASLTQSSVDDLIATVEQKDMLLGRATTEQDMRQRNAVFRTMLNALIYIYSQDPLIDRSRPQKETGLSNKEIQRRGMVINECTIPVYFLNRQYVTERHYSIDSTWVDSFFRWQRCGPQYSQVRLTLVKAHERTYKESTRP
jgi:hypothetical protein